MLFYFFYDGYNGVMNQIIIKNQMKTLWDPSIPVLSNLCNLTALLHDELEHLNWVGFYFVDIEQNCCFLGPFQGRLACTRIPIGQGVVGTCAARKKSMNIPDVHAFPGHIACDSASNSEFVAPVFKNDAFFAVLDVDSDQFGRFGPEEESIFLEAAALISGHLSNAK